MFEELERIISNEYVSYGTKIAMLKAKFDIKPIGERKTPIETYKSLTNDERLDLIGMTNIETGEII